MATALFQLVMRSGPTPGKTYPLSKSEIYIGRDINNDITISDAEISRKHVRLILQGGGYIVEDLGSTNGSFVNGNRLMGPFTLRPGDILMLGENVSLLYESISFDLNATLMAGQQIGGGAPGSGRESTPQPPPPQVQSYLPPPPPPLDSFSRAVGETPPDVPLEALPSAPSKKMSCQKWALAGCSCLVLMLCMIVVGVLLIYMAVPNLVEQLACFGPLKIITDAILQLTGQPYYCP